MNTIMLIEHISNLNLYGCLFEMNLNSKNHFERSKALRTESLAFANDGATCNHTELTSDEYHGHVRFTHIKQTKRQTMIYFLCALLNIICNTRVVFIQHNKRAHFEDFVNNFVHFFHQILIN